jgi:hypothetical protein
MWSFSEEQQISIGACILNDQALQYSLDEIII